MVDIEADRVNGQCSLGWRCVTGLEEREKMLTWKPVVVAMESQSKTYRDSPEKGE